MNHFFRPLLIATLCLAGCTPSVEKRANELIEKYTKKWLVNPDSYEMISTELDSAFAPYCDREFHKILMEWKKYDDRKAEVIVHLEKEKKMREYCIAEIEKLKKMHGAEARKELNMNLQEYEMQGVRMKKMNDAITEIENIKENIAKVIRAELKKGPVFMGYKAIHRHTSKNEEGETVENKMYYVLDKELKKVLIVLDAESEEFKTMTDLTRKERWQ